MSVEVVTFDVICGQCYATCNILANQQLQNWLHQFFTLDYITLTHSSNGIELVKLFGLEWNGDFEKLMNHSCNQELSLCKDDPAGSKFSQKYIRESGKVESSFKHLTVRYFGIIDPHQGKSHCS